MTKKELIDLIKGYPDDATVFVAIQTDKRTLVRYAMNAWGNEESIYIETWKEEKENRAYEKTIR